MQDQDGQNNNNIELETREREIMEGKKLFFLYATDCWPQVLLSADIGEQSSSQFSSDI